MIFDTMDNLKLYKETIPYLDEINKFLDNNNLKNLLEGKYEIIKDKLYAISSEYTTNPNGPLNGNLEVHKKYIDLQIIISGEEKIRFSNKENLTIFEIYNEEKDVEFLKSQINVSEFYLQNEQFAVFFPQDAHEPGCAINKFPKKIKKIVFKIEFPK
ncbi:MAG: YhcH/YjgK/YiaL family protein [Candidatus Muirbacterium halophilum]|nr:YhcH/YjgK/YiaL family protein [Candidatus Muirbacterium halophilum]MCK9476753.1 YhcH/YjgK/YiaL family protein [Candidatus Muirbacterium halophilum]